MACCAAHEATRRKAELAHSKLHSHAPSASATAAKNAHLLEASHMAEHSSSYHTLPGLFRGSRHSLWVSSSIVGLGNYLGAGGRGSLVSTKGYHTPGTCATAYNRWMRPLIVDPRKSRLIGPWDLMTSLALIFTTFVTPYEVALLNDEVPFPQALSTAPFHRPFLYSAQALSPVQALSPQLSLFHSSPSLFATWQVRALLSHHAA